jgi:tryptophan-rich sensory protein
MNINKSKIKTYAVSLAIALITGGLSALLTNMGMDSYRAAEKPALTPPEIVFPIVWTILFILMGISAARIWLSPDSKNKVQGLRIYILQLTFNFIWSILFFNLQAYGFAFIWLIILWLLILLMIISFSKSDKLAAYLQIPYLLWVTFASYLNLMVWLLNK